MTKSSQVIYRRYKRVADPGYDNILNNTWEKCTYTKTLHKHQQKGNSDRILPHLSRTSIIMQNKACGCTRVRHCTTPSCTLESLLWFDWYTTDLFLNRLKPLSLALSYTFFSGLCFITHTHTWIKQRSGKSSADVRTENLQGKGYYWFSKLEIEQLLSSAVKLWCSFLTKWLPQGFFG